MLGKAGCRGSVLICRAVMRPGIGITCFVKWVVMQYLGLPSNSLLGRCGSLIAHKCIMCRIKYVALPVRPLDTLIETQYHIH